MTEQVAASGSAALKPANYIAIGLAIAIISPFTGFAWPFALLTGLVIGRAERDSELGVRVPAGTRIIRILAVTGGVIAMMLAGAVVGGLIGFLIVALAAFSERAAGLATATERTMAAIFLFLGTAAGWLLLYVVLGFRFTFTIGA